MKRQLLNSTILVSLIIFNQYAFGEHDENGFFVWADVVDADPIISHETIRTPTTHCVQEPAPHVIYRDRKKSALPAIFGGVLGGAIANQFGGGNGKKALTIIGAIAGASIANRSQEYSRHGDRHSRRTCHTTYDTQEIETVDGFDVTYRYFGREFQKTTKQHPGRRVRVYVTVDPVAERHVATI
jgi:uncharacterized protein YcfJ